MRRIRAAIVDDEPPARRGIRARLERWQQVEVVIEAGNASRAVRDIRRHHPDVVFLDIEMPGADGFTLLEQLPRNERPIIVFVTAHEDRALRAFDVEAFDYVLKPIDDARFDRTMQRVVARCAESLPGRVDRVIIRDRGRAVALEPSTIDWVKSDGDYVRIYAGRSNYLHDATLTSLAEQLPPDRFVRIHRSTIVNVERIHALEPVTNGDYVVLLTTGARLRLSRTHRKTLARQLGSHLQLGGTGSSTPATDSSRRRWSLVPQLFILRADHNGSEGDDDPAASATRRHVGGVCRAGRRHGDPCHDGSSGASGRLRRAARHRAGNVEERVADAAQPRRRLAIHQDTSGT